MASESLLCAPSCSCLCLCPAWNLSPSGLLSFVLKVPAGGSVCAGGGVRAGGIYIQALAQSGPHLKSSSSACPGLWALLPLTILYFAFAINTPLRSGSGQILWVGGREVESLLCSFRAESLSPSLTHRHTHAQLHAHLHKHRHTSGRAPSY